MDAGLPNDHFIMKDGVPYAGEHLIIDLWGASGLNDRQRIEDALSKAAKVAGATLLFLHTHVFEENGGISGVAVLAESHISIHTWPERGYAALDVFMCGTANPHACLPVFKEAFDPKHLELSPHLRGKFPA